ncbi:hypothetical protein EKO04_004548 [Ascochyta lentis]|uniref:Uncharacterized protein n=1 Tax=Ascochyta lentis TaxID=205686 RepID=A0A8H7J3M3_9PLEO|nr:hypothetical protein EKO04_004548 [Ascochyta lentis]
MGIPFSTNAANAALTADTIEKYYDILARSRAAHAAAKAKTDTPDADEKGQDQGDHTEDADVVNSDTENEDPTHASSGHADNDPEANIIRTAGVPPESRGDVIAHLNTAVRALTEKDMDMFSHAIGALMKFGGYLNVLARKMLKWVEAHPWETAAIVIPLILLACTPAILGAAGFTAGGIAAGSAAAGIQAGIGSVAAGSAFATLTSAAMGGYGAVIVFGGVWAVPAATLGAIAVWKRWQGGNDGGQGDAVILSGGDDGDAGDDADGDKTKKD